MPWILCITSPLCSSFKIYKLDDFFYIASKVIFQLTIGKILRACLPYQFTVYQYLALPSIEAEMLAGIKIED